MAPSQTLPIKNNRMSVRVIPNASKTEVRDIKDDIIKIAVAAPPDKNKANLELIKFLKKKFNLRVQIISGEKSREKVVEVLQ